MIVIDEKYLRVHVCIGAAIKYFELKRQNGCYFADDIIKHIFLNENICISIQISLNVFPWV